MFALLQQPTNSTNHVSATNKRNRGSSGFTLIELLVVIAVIGLLSSVVLASLGTARERARATAIVAEIQELQKAFEIYHLKHGQYIDGVVGGAPNGLHSEKNDFDGDGESDFVEILQPLVDSRAISTIPQRTPRNDNEHYMYVTNETYMDTSSPTYITCGDEPTHDYVLFIDSSIEIPSLPYYDLVGSNIDNAELNFLYCITAPR